MHGAIAKVTLPKGQDDSFLCTETAGDTTFAQFYRFLRKLESSLVRSYRQRQQQRTGKCFPWDRTLEQHRPIKKVGDSTALLNISKGTRENICNRTSRPLGPEDGSDWVRWTSRTSGSVITRKWKTSSRNLWAYRPKTDGEGRSGVFVPSLFAGMESINSTHPPIVVTDIDCLHTL